jgi:hypothetical protein
MSIRGFLGDGAQKSLAEKKTTILGTCEINTGSTRKVPMSSWGSVWVNFANYSHYSGLYLHKAHLVYFIIQ